MTAKIFEMHTRETRREFITVREVAELLNVSTRTVYAWVEKKIIPFERKGGSLRFRRSVIEAWNTDQAA